MNYIAFISLLLSIFSPIAIDLYISTIPNISEEFSRLGELTLSFYLIGVGLGYFFMGKLYDDYGAHKIANFNLLIYALTSLGIFFTFNFETILFLRLLQGISISGLAVTYTVLLKDNFEPKETAKYYGYTHSVMNVAPATMPFLGLFLTNYFGDWRYSFLLIFIFSILTLIFIFPYTKKIPIKNHNQESFSFLKNKLYKKYSLLAILSLTILLAYVTTSPSLFIDNFKWTNHEFSIFFAINGALLAIGGFLFSKLINTYSIEKALLIGYSVVTFSGCVMLLNINEYSYITAIFIFSLFFPTIIASSTMLSLSDLKSDTGKAVSVINGLQMILSGAFGWLFGLFMEQLIYSFAIFLIVNGLYGIYVYFSKK